LEETEDLAAVAAGALASGLRLLWAGSAGLAQHLAVRHAMRKVPSLGTDSGREEMAKGRPVAVVVGSASSMAHEQLSRLLEVSDVESVILDPDLVLDRASRAVEKASRALSGALSRGHDVALGLVPSGTGRIDSSLAMRLSGVLGDLVDRHENEIGGFVLTGGATAQAVLRASGVTALRLTGELETGVPTSMTLPVKRPVVTKAGDFGDGLTLVRALHSLHPS
jgi:uncharacterized protein YgbK (DUF1537 family)